MIAEKNIRDQLRSYFRQRNEDNVMKTVLSYRKEGKYEQRNYKWC